MHDHREEQRFEQALKNLRNQHLWGDLSDEKYQCERNAPERQQKLTVRPAQAPLLPNLERAAQLLKELPAFWLHPGVTDERREGLLQAGFSNITIDGKDFMCIEPKPAYTPLFATIIADQEYEYRGLDSTLTMHTLNNFAGRLIETGSVAWLRRAA